MRVGVSVGVGAYLDCFCYLLGWLEATGRYGNFLTNLVDTCVVYRSFVGPCKPYLATHYTSKNDQHSCSPAEWLRVALQPHGPYKGSTNTFNKQQGRLE